MNSNSGKVRKRGSRKTKRRKLRGTVEKMIAVMESKPESLKDPVSEFLVTGRTGRRNAMADILGPNASVTSGDLPKRLESLTTADEETSAGPSTTVESNETADRETTNSECCQPPATSSETKFKTEKNS